MRALVISVMAIVAACAPQVATPTTSPTATATADATAPAPASGSPAPAPAPPPASPGLAVAGLQTLGLGQLRGDWVFVVRETSVADGVRPAPPAVPATGARIQVDVIAMPLDGTDQRIVASYLKSAGGVTLPPSEILPRQFSPDGRRLLLNTPMGIVLLELETGSAGLLTEGRDPVWGYGDRVAFIRGDPGAPRTQTTTWVVAASGGTPFEHICGAALAWTFDGSSCIRPAAGGIVFDSPTQPAQAPGFGWSVAFDSHPSYEVPISVRPAAGVTVLAIASTDLPRGGGGPVQTRTDGPYQHQIEVLSTPGAGHQIVVASESGRLTEVRFAEPRWNPRSDQIVYRIEGSRRMETHIVDANTKQDVIARISGVARAAEWTPNGEQIVYLTHPGTPIGPATEVRAVRPISGRDDRVLMTAPGSSTFTSVATRGYASPTGRVVSSNAGRVAAKPDASARGSKALEAFAADLYGELANEPGNLVFSPYSVAAALAMTRAGAAGETARQMDEVLHADIAGDLDEAMNALDRALARRPGSYTFGSATVPLELETANQLWGQQGVECGQEFLDRLAAYYGAGMRIVDYVNATEDARETINEWVAERTHDRIPELIEKDVLNAYTRLVLTNAIYLNAKWQREFAPAQASAFHRLDGSTTQVPLMRRSGYGGYARGAAHHVVELSYVGGLWMLLIVPDAGSFGVVEQSFGDAEDLGVLTRALRPMHVNLGLPRFEIRSAVKLVPALRALGMPIAFTEQADFSKMSPRVPMLIQDVVHQGFIAVDEQGTEAAAATAVVGGATCGPSEWVDLTVDRPFLFLIRDDETGAILFMGRVLDPGAP